MDCQHFYCVDGYIYAVGTPEVAYPICESAKGLCLGRDIADEHYHFDPRLGVPFFVD